MTKDPREVGGIVDEGISAPMALFRNIPFHSEVKYTPEMEREAKSFSWSDNTIERSFVNTAIYPPLFYIPAAVGYWLGKGADIGVVQTLYLSRNADATCFDSFFLTRFTARSACPLTSRVLLYASDDLVSAFLCFSGRLNVRINRLFCWFA